MLFELSMVHARTTAWLQVSEYYNVVFFSSIFFFFLLRIRSLSLSFEIFIDFQMSDSLAFHAKDCLSSANQW